MHKGAWQWQLETSSAFSACSIALGRIPGSGEVAALSGRLAELSAHWSSAAGRQVAVATGCASSLLCHVPSPGQTTAPGQLAQGPLIFAAPAAQLTGYVIVGGLTTPRAEAFHWVDH